MSVPDPASAEAFGAALLDLARFELERTIGGSTSGPPAADVPGLDEARGCFVSLHGPAGLRGCLGRPEAADPLRMSVPELAVSAALRDPRFPPVRAGELPGLTIEVSVLTPPSPLRASGRADVLRALRPYRDGLILEVGSRSATFLPQVWEQIPEPERFLDQLLVKAGLPTEPWDPDTRLRTYRVRAWREDRPEVGLST